MGWTARMQDMSLMGQVAMRYMPLYQAALAKKSPAPQVSFEDYVGREAQDRLGKKKWRKAVFDVAERLSHALQADYVVLGGGEAEELDTLPPGCRAGDNALALVGGFLLWQAPKREHMHRLAQAYNGRRASNGKRRTTRR